MNATMVRAYEYCGADLECKITSFVVDADDDIEYTAYGIRITDAYGETMYECADISTDRAIVESFITICETHFVSLIHIDAVLDDYLF